MMTASAKAYDQLQCPVADHLSDLCIHPYYSVREGRRNEQYVRKWRAVASLYETIVFAKSAYAARFERRVRKK